MAVFYSWCWWTCVSFLLNKNACLRVFWVINRNNIFVYLGHWGKELNCGSRIILLCLTLKLPFFFLTAPGFILLTTQRSTVRVRARVNFARSAEVMGSRRKVKSWVHGGVKEPRARLLFAPPPPPPRFLPTGGCAPGATAASPSNSPQTRTTCLFFCVYEPFPRQENSSITTSVGAASWALCSLSRLLQNSFVSSLHDVKFCCLFIPSPEVWAFSTNTQLRNNSSPTF